MYDPDEARLESLLLSDDEFVASSNSTNNRIEAAVAKASPIPKAHSSLVLCLRNVHLEDVAALLLP